MLTFRCRLFEVDNDALSDSKPREQTQFSVNAPNCDLAIKEARSYLHKRGKVVRSVNITHNRLQIVAYVWRKRPKDRLEPQTVRESELRKGT